MALYFIEMGQGVIARPEMRVKTSALYSCTLITGWSQTTGYGGAFHFPANGLRDDDVVAAMALWTFYLKPTAIKLLFAGASSAMGMGGPGAMGTPQTDRKALTAWVTEETGLIPTSAMAIAACMVLTANSVFRADDRGKLHDEFDGDMRDVSRFRAGDHSYEDYILVGRNSN